MAITRARLHHLIDHLPEEKVSLAERYLRYLEEDIDPVLEALRQAPEDDEPETTEEWEAIARAKADLAVGRVTSLAEVKRELGL